MIKNQLTDLANAGLNDIAASLENLLGIDLRNAVDEILDGGAYDLRTPIVDGFGKTTNLIRVLNIIKRKSCLAAA